MIVLDKVSLQTRYAPVCRVRIYHHPSVIHAKEFSRVVVVSIGRDVLYSTLLYSTLLYSTLLCSTLLYSYCLQPSQGHRVK